MAELRYLVSYGLMRDVAVFTTSPAAKYNRRQEVVVTTDRGIEVGTILAELRETSADSDVEDKGVSQPSDQWRLLRALGPVDATLLEANAALRHEGFETWQQRLARLPIPVELVDVEYLLDAAVVLHVLAEEDADFSPVQATLSKIAGQRLIFRRFGDDPSARRNGGCSGGGCTCGRKEAEAAPTKPLD